MENILKDKLSKVLFHGTLMDRAANIVLDGIDYNKFNDRADFGKGFYLTDSYALAKNTALSRYNQEMIAKQHPYPPVVIRVKIRCHNLYDYNIKEFYGDNDIWRRFICCNRWYKNISSVCSGFDHNIDGKYDIVIGLTADGKMSGLNKLIKKDGYVLSDDFIKNIKPYSTQYTRKVNNTIKIFNTKAYQISIHNKYILKHCIDCKTYDIITLEKEDGYYE